MRSLFSLTDIPQFMLGRLGVLIVLAALFAWIYTALRLRFSKSGKTEYRLAINMYLIESAMAGIFLLALYVGVFVTVNEWQCFGKDIFWLLLPEMVTLVLLLALFAAGMSILSKHKKYNI